MFGRGLLIMFVVSIAFPAATARSYGDAPHRFPPEGGRGRRQAETEVGDHAQLGAPPQCSNDSVIACGDGDGFVCLEQVCDGIDHCPDGSDEQRCEALSASRCAGDGVVACTDGVGAVCTEQLCDGALDCLDGSDELSCEPVPSCPGDSLFKCSDGYGGVCNHQMCDGVEDCTDGSDEQDCGAASDPICPSDSSRQCADGDGDVCSEQVCDGTADCNDGSDELDCEGPTTTPASQHSSTAVPTADHDKQCPGDALYRCADGRGEICSVQRCDSALDCSDGSDELNCEAPQTSPIWTSPPTSSPVGPNTTPVSATTPEAAQLPSHKTCAGDASFVCAGGSEVCVDQVCDGVQDCPDGSDELDCEGPNTTSLPTSTAEAAQLPSHKTCAGDASFVCAGGSEVCVDQVCDGVQDCPDGSDEHDCGSPRVQSALNPSLPPTSSRPSTASNANISSSLSIASGPHAQPSPSPASAVSTESSSTSASGIHTSSIPPVLVDLLLQNQSIDTDASNVSSPPSASGANTSITNKFFSSFSDDAKSLPPPDSDDSNIEDSSATGVLKCFSNVSVISTSSTSPDLDDVILQDHLIDSDVSTALIHSNSASSAVTSHSPNSDSKTSPSTLTVMDASISIDIFPSLREHTDSSPSDTENYLNIETSFAPGVRSASSFSSATVIHTRPTSPLFDDVILRSHPIDSDTSTTPSLSFNTSDVAVGLSPSHSSGDHTDPSLPIDSDYLSLGNSSASDVSTVSSSPITSVIPTSLTSAVLDNVLTQSYSVVSDTSSINGTSISIGSTDKNDNVINSLISITASDTSSSVSPTPGIRIHANSDIDPNSSDPLSSASIAFESSTMPNSSSFSDVISQRSSTHASNIPFPTTFSSASKVPITVSSSINVDKGPVPYTSTVSDAPMLISPSSQSLDLTSLTLPFALFTPISKPFSNPSGTPISSSSSPFSTLRYSTPFTISPASSSSSAPITQSSAPDSEKSASKSMSFNSSSSPSTTQATVLSTLASISHVSGASNVPSHVHGPENAKTFSLIPGVDDSATPIMPLAYDSSTPPSSLSLSGLATPSSSFTSPDGSTLLSSPSDSQRQTLPFSPLSSGTSNMSNSLPVYDFSTRSESLFESDISPWAFPTSHVSVDSTTSSITVTSLSPTLKSHLSTLDSSTQSTVSPSKDALTSLSISLDSNTNILSGTTPQSVSLIQNNSVSTSTTVFALNISTIPEVRTTSSSLLVSKDSFSSTSPDVSPASLLISQPDLGNPTSENLGSELISRSFQSRDSDESIEPNSLLSSDVLTTSTFIHSDVSAPQISLALDTLSLTFSSVSPSVSNFPVVSSAQTMPNSSVSQDIQSHSSYPSTSEYSNRPHPLTVSSLPTLPSHIPLSRMPIQPNSSRTFEDPTSPGHSFVSPTVTTTTSSTVTYLPPASLALTSSDVPTQPDFPTQLNHSSALDASTSPKPLPATGLRTFPIRRPAPHIPPWSIRPLLSPLFRRKHGRN